MTFAEHYRQWATLMRSGVPLSRAIIIFARRRDRWGRAAQRIERRLAAGAPLSEALNHEADLYPETDRALIAAGERSGRLDAVFQRLADWKEAEHRMDRALLTGMIPVATVLHVAAILLPFSRLIGRYFSTGVFPWAEMLSSVFSLLLPFYALGLLVWWLRRPRNRQSVLRKIMDETLSRVPVLGGALRSLALSRYTFAFHAFYEAGLPLAETARWSEEACGNLTLARALAPARHAVENGHPFSEGLTHPWIPADVAAIWTSAEEAGSLHRELAHLSEQLREDAEHRLTHLSRWLPRVVYFLLLLYIASEIIRFMTSFQLERFGDLL